MSLRRAYAWVLFVAVAAYVNSVANGFAYDDNSVVPLNPVVTDARWGEALLGPYWSDAQEGGTLWRPVTITSFTAEWRLWGGDPLGYHAVNVLLHALVSALVLALLARFVAAPAALAGAVFFAIHPVHVEAVANVVGRSELYAGAAMLGACLVYLDGGGGRPWRRGMRLGALSLLYLVGLGAKEIAVTLPGVLLLLEVCRHGAAPLRDRLHREVAVFVTLAAVLAAYLVLRASVLGTITGEMPAPALYGLTTGQRILTALTAWPQYLRLMVFPRTLSADYAPGVMAVAHGVTPEVILGAVVLLFWLGAAAWAFRSAPAVSAGLGWFVVAVLPVSNLLVPTGILLAERTLYLPSVGAAFVVGGAVEAVRRAGWPARTLRTAAGAAGLAAAALFLRTVDRNPTWMSTYVVLNTLASEHPESYLALRSRASGLDHVGEFEQAARYYELAVRFAPGHYGLLAEAGGFYARRRQDARAEELLRSAISLWEDRPAAYRLLAQLRIQQGRGREAHAIALGGLARAGPDRELWALVSEAYIAKGDLEAALRARRAALGQDATSVHNWNRLADLLEALGRQDQAEAARARAGALEATAGGAGARAGEPGR